MSDGTSIVSNIRNVYARANSERSCQQAQEAEEARFAVDVQQRATDLQRQKLIRRFRVHSRNTQHERDAIDVILAGSLQEEASFDPPYSDAWELALVDFQEKAERRLAQIATNAEKLRWEFPSGADPVHLPLYPRRHPAEHL